MFVAFRTVGELHAQAQHLGRDLVARAAFEDSDDLDPLMFHQTRRRRAADKVAVCVTRLAAYPSIR